MLISYKHRFLFVHIAKTGGTSVRSALRPYRWGFPYGMALSMASVVSQLTRPKHALGIKFPRHAKAVAAKEMLPDELFAGLFKFAVVRNPWDLQVSSYHHLKREHPAVMGAIPDFPAFIRRKLDPQRASDYLLDISSERQWEYVCDLDGSIIVDYIARFETLARDFERICERIGVAPPALPHERRAADRGRYREYYDDTTRALVAEHYAEDIQRFGYRFE